LGSPVGVRPEGASCDFAKMVFTDPSKFAIGEVVATNSQVILDRSSQDIGQGSRDLVCELYGYSPSEQLRIENYLDSLTQFTPLDIPEIYVRSNADAKQYFRTCAVYEGEEAKVPHMESPPRYNFRRMVKILDSRAQHITKAEIARQVNLAFFSIKEQADVKVRDSCWAQTCDCDKGGQDYEAQCLPCPLSKNIFQGYEKVLGIRVN
jgi:hypothetical protein